MARRRCKFGINKNTKACLLHPRPKKGSWTRKAPTTKQRRSMPARCFADPKNKKYPVCPAGKRASKTALERAKPTCQGVEAAYERARQQKKPAVARRALRMKKQLGCRW